ncbi:MAG: ATP-dependent Lhr-like helicase, partial [Nonlabens sp.]
MTKKELFHIAEDYFQQQGWTAFPFQKQTWDAFISGKNGLLNAPTGSGKTYALWVAIVLNYIKSNPNYKTKNKKGLKAIWITPLRSLSQEIAQTSQKFVDGIGLPFTVGIRSGDTSTKERAAQKKSMPDLLITTPESLHLLLATKDHVHLLKDCNAIVIDEWHELLGTKRGVQMELGLSRLAGINKNLRIWGISATIGNLEQARQVLLGVDSSRFRESVLIKANLKKKIEVRSIIPE